MVGTPCAGMILAGGHKLSGLWIASVFPALSVPTVFPEMLFFPLYFFFVAITIGKCKYPGISLDCALLLLRQPVLACCPVPAASLPPLGKTPHVRLPGAAGCIANPWGWGSGCPTCCQEGGLGGFASPSLAGGGRLHHALAQGLRLCISSATPLEAKVLVPLLRSPGTNYPARSLLMVLLFWSASLWPLPAWINRTKLCCRLPGSPGNAAKSCPEQAAAEII